MDEEFTSPEEAVDAVDVTDGQTANSESPQQIEAVTIAVEDYNTIAVKSVSIGALCGAIFMIVGFAYLGIVHIFKKV